MAELVQRALGIAILPLLVAQHRNALTQPTEVLGKCQTELWLLTHAKSKHLRRAAAVFTHLSQNLLLE